MVQNRRHKRRKEIKNYRDLPGEEWRPVEGLPDCEGFYISNKGRFRKEKKLRRIAVDDSGYCRCNIGHRKYRVHRLVAAAFIPNPDNLPVVDHIDMDKQNNCVENLRWVTQQENSQFAVDAGCGSLRRLHTMVLAVDQEDQGILYNSLAQASRETGVDKTSVGKVAKGLEKSRGGYRFIRLDSIEDKRDERKPVPKLKTEETETEEDE